MWWLIFCQRNSVLLTIDDRRSRQTIKRDIRQQNVWHLSILISAGQILGQIFSTIIFQFVHTFFRLFISQIFFKQYVSFFLFWWKEREMSLSISCFEMKTIHRKWFLKVEWETMKPNLTRILENSSSPMACDLVSPQTLSVNKSGMYSNVKFMLCLILHLFICPKVRKSHVYSPPKPAWPPLAFPFWN